jgi:hypothetical protein
MPSQQAPQQELTISEKMQIVQNLAAYPALTMLVFIRRKVGYRMLKPSRLITMAFILKFIDGLTHFIPFASPAGEIFEKFPLVMLAFGFVQRWERWRELCKGERWHTMSPGISYLELVPLPGFLKRHRRIYRFVEPFCLFIGSMFIGIFFSQGLGRWVFFCSFCLFIYEQALYEKQLDRDLDVLDGMIAAEVQQETVEYFASPESSQQERTIQETGGIPTGVAFDIHKQIEKLRAKQTTEQEKSQAEAFVRQVEKIKEVASAMPRPLKPAAASLAPTSAPDNLVLDQPPAEPENPVSEVPPENPGAPRQEGGIEPGSGVAS